FLCCGGQGRYIGSDLVRSTASAFRFLTAWWAGLGLARPRCGPLAGTSRASLRIGGRRENSFSEPPQAASLDFRHSRLLAPIRAACLARSTLRPAQASPPRLRVANVEWLVSDMREAVA